MATKKAKRILYRSAKTGKFISKGAVKKNPATSVTETVPRKTNKKKPVKKKPK